MYSGQISAFAVLVIASVSGAVQLPAPLDEAGGAMEMSSPVLIRSERGLFSRSRSRSKAAPSPDGHPPPPPDGHPPPPPPKPRSRMRNAAGMLLPVAAGAAAGYLTTSLVLNQMKKHNPCALDGVGFTANTQMDSKIAADQRCQNMLNKYSGWFKNPNAGGATNPQQNGMSPGTMNTQQNGMNTQQNGMNTQQNGMNTQQNGVSPQQTQQMSPQKSQQTPQKTTSGTGGSAPGMTRRKRALSAPGSSGPQGVGPQGYNNMMSPRTGLAGGGGSPCAGATFASCQEMNGDSTCIVQTPSGGVPITKCA